MESSAPMMLPKGIVTNTTKIYTQVASYPTVPVDKLWQYWHVYTTTNKKLQDPTARRLENFWWHVWGSDCRYLAGSTLARLYEDISLGSTIAPLQGPPNRWEGPDALPVTRQLVVAHLSRERNPQPNPASLPTTNTSDDSIKSLPPANTPRHPAPHPILKKSRGPSASGPRPTARFVTPHESAEEADKNGELAVSANITTTVLQTTPTSPKKRPSPAVKRFVVASAASRRRPSLPRKTSPQSPITTASAVARQAGISATARVASQPRTVSPIPERASAQSSHESEGARFLRPSVKALGKRPAEPPSPTTADFRAEKLVEAPPSSFSPPEGLAAPRQQRASIAACTPSLVAEGAPFGAPSAVSIASTDMFVIEHPPAMQRAQSHNGYGRYSDMRNLSQGLYTGATASTTHVAAQGTIIDQTGSLPVSSVASLCPSEPLAVPGPYSALSSSLLGSRLTPTQPNPSPNVPMGRTRSQLTLLLEREKARTSVKTRSRS